jgi:hypothetical protein
MKQTIPDELWLEALPSKTYLGTDANGKVIEATVDLSGYVPYTGATGNVALGIYNLTSKSLITTDTTGAHLTLGTNNVFADDTILMQWGSDDDYMYSGLPFRMYWSCSDLGYGALMFDDGLGNGLSIKAGYYFGNGTTLTGIGTLEGANVWTTVNTFRRADIRTTRTEAVFLENITAATSAKINQDSPSLRFKGHSWVSSADYTFDFSMEGKSNSTNPYFQIACSKNGGAYSNVFSVDSSGQFLQEVIRASWNAGQTLTAGFRCSNDKAATATTNEYSGCFKFHSQGWRTTGAGSSRLMYFWEVNAPETGVNEPVGVHLWMYGTAAFPTVNTEAMRIEWGDRLGVVFNDKAIAGYNFRIEGNSDANNFFSDGANNRIGIGMNNPAYKLDVTGEVNASTGYRCGGTAPIADGSHVFDVSIYTQVDIVTKGGIITAITVS